MAEFWLACTSNKLQAKNLWEPSKPHLLHWVPEHPYAQSAVAQAETQMHWPATRKVKSIIGQEETGRYYIYKITILLVWDLATNLDFIAVSMAIVRDAFSEKPSTLQNNNKVALVDCWWRESQINDSTDPHPPHIYTWGGISVTTSGLKILQCPQWDEGE